MADTMTTDVKTAALMGRHIKQAETLIEALPYIREFRDCVFVVKYGGSAMVQDELKAGVLLDLLLLKFVGIKPVVVHGGGKQISALLKKVGKQPTFIDGLRVTDAETMDIVEMVLAGNINKEIVADLNRQGGRAVGLTGKDGDILLAKKIKSAVDYGQVGEVVSVNTDLIQLLLDRDYIPVIAPVGVDRDGTTLNLNADTVAGALAASLRAEKFILITDEPGVLRDQHDPATLIKTITMADHQQLLKDKVIDGGMIPKLESCIDALQRGVKKAHIISGAIPHSLLIEIFTAGGSGTEIVLKGKKEKGKP